MRILALDVGTKTIGVAVSDPLGLIAQPVETIQRGKRELTRLVELIEEYDVEEIVVGLPRRTDGSLGPEARYVQEFASRLECKLKAGWPLVDIVFWDERFTTVQAERVLLEADVSRAGRREVVDQVAAGFLLQSYLDRRIKTHPCGKDKQDQFKLVKRRGAVMNEETIVLVDEEGLEHNFTLYRILEVDDVRYALLVPEEEPDEGIVAFRLEVDEDGEDVLVMVEEDDEFDRVVSALEEDDWGEEWEE